MSPNLRHLETKYDFLQLLIDNEDFSSLFQQRITHLHIAESSRSEIVIESMSLTLFRLVSFFSSLKHLYFNLCKANIKSQSKVLVLLKHLHQWISLISFGIVNVIITDDLCLNDTQQWIRRNSNIEESKLFYANYTDKTIRLWF